MRSRNIFWRAQKTESIPTLLHISRITIKPSCHDTYEALYFAAFYLLFFQIFLLYSDTQVGIRVKTFNAHLGSTACHLSPYAVHRWRPCNDRVYYLVLCTCDRLFMSWVNKSLTAWSISYHILKSSPPAVFYLRLLERTNWATSNLIETNTTANHNPLLCIYIKAIVGSATFLCLVPYFERLVPMCNKQGTYDRHFKPFFGIWVYHQPSR